MKKNSILGTAHAKEKPLLELCTMNLIARSLDTLYPQA